MGAICCPLSKPNVIAKPFYRHEHVVIATPPMRIEKRKCNGCGKYISQDNKSGKCKDCYVKRLCSECNKPISHDNQSGKCRTCLEISVMSKVCGKCNRSFLISYNEQYKTMCGRSDCFTSGEFEQQKVSEKLSKKGYSQKAINWLKYIMSKEHIHIQHAENGGEHKVTINGYTYYFDGYCKDTNTVYEFHGDKFHGNPNVYNSKDLAWDGKTYGWHYYKTCKREESIREAGYNLVTIWESDYDKIIL